MARFENKTHVGIAALCGGQPFCFVILKDHPNLMLEMLSQITATATQYYLIKDNTFTYCHAGMLNRFVRKHLA